MKYSKTPSSLGKTFDVTDNSNISQIMETMKRANKSLHEDIIVPISLKMRNKSYHGGAGNNSTKVY